MLTVYDVQLELRDAVDYADLIKLKDHFKALKIDAIGLNREDVKAKTAEINFTIYGNFGPFMMKKMVTECTENIFPGSIVGLLHNS